MIVDVLTWIVAVVGMLVLGWIAAKALSSGLFFRRQARRRAAIRKMKNPLAAIRELERMEDDYRDRFG